MVNGPSEMLLEGSSQSLVQRRTFINASQITAKRMGGWGASLPLQNVMPCVPFAKRNHWQLSAAPKWDPTYVVDFTVFEILVFSGFDNYYLPLRPVPQQHSSDPIAWTGHGGHTGTLCEMWMKALKNLSNNHKYSEQGHL